MFGGLISYVARVASLENDPRGGARLQVEAPEAMAEDVADKDSIAVNGVCLTVASHDGRLCAFDVVPETLERSALGTLRAGDRVNFELSLRLGERIGGHFVYGHVDATTRILTKAPEGQGFRISLELPPGLEPFLVEKGYVALDGVSLTIAALRAGRFEVALIPETLARTTFGAKTAGDRLNLEIDPIARYACAAASYYARGTDAAHDELAWAYDI
jgi:riboflavin synthase